jgi:hypothetical protein
LTRGLFDASASLPGLLFYFCSASDAVTPADSAATFKDCFYILLGILAEKFI